MFAGTAYTVHGPAKKLTCVSPGIMPSQEEAAKIAALHVIPMEAPPLSAFSLSEPPRSGVWVHGLEVALINYALVSDRLMLQVAMKLIHPLDGRVVGRARAGNASDMANLGPLDQAFANDAAHFKRVFSEAAEPLVEECLLSLGMLR